MTSTMVQPEQASREAQSRSLVSLHPIAQLLLMKSINADGTPQLRTQAQKSGLSSKLGSPLMRYITFF
mgnify:CR=1 FL=1